MVVSTLILLSATFYASRHRDVGSGLIATHGGRKRALSFSRPIQPGNAFRSFKLNRLDYWHGGPRDLLRLHFGTVGDVEIQP